jgi:kynurenine formamidase
MCVSACTRKIAQDLTRRNFLRSAAGLAVVTAAAGCAPVSATPPAGSAAAAMGASSAGSANAAGPFTFSQIVDLTHTLTTDFPTFSGLQQLEMEQLVNLADNGYNAYRWLVEEHTGTHMDSPFHFSDGPTADQIPADDLFGPLAVIDIRSKAADNPDAQLTPDDLMAWEADHGPLPDGAIVAMLSGWQDHLGTDKFRNADADNVMHFPGFHIEAIEMLLGERNAKGILVDTLSLDFGPSPDFAVHYRWLPAVKWGIENVANLALLPPAGAIAVVGGPKIAGASGGPTRIFALV